MVGLRSRVLAAAAVVGLLLAPAMADARLGGGSSMGSRGSMTFSAPPSTRTAPGYAAPMQRTLTPNSPTPGYGSMPVYGQRSPFASGLMGGLLGAGLFGLLFSGSFFGHGMGFGGFLGFLLQIFLIVMIGRFLWRRFMGGQSVFAGGPGLYARGGAPSGMMGGMPGAGPSPVRQSGGPPVAITQADFQEFEQLLQASQAAWSAGDLNALRGMATPEMVGYFSEQLSDLASRGVTNTVTDVRLESGDLAQAWAEAGREYATVAMRFSMIDVTRDSGGRVVDGSVAERVLVTEVWTFVRARGGHWILSAIQQAR
ncbi:MAG TPA: TIM44-like domain-containing protein [Acetobacteraceae bacterium]|nr:TIM44-like domain-containing protein [Acetobacteraceae bacterium]